MPYIKKTYRFPDSIEVEKVFSARYGQKGPHEPKKLKTKEEMEKINLKNCITKLRRKIKANFSSEDYHMVLTYKKDARPDREKVPKILENFFRNTRRAYRKAGSELKYIIVTEYENKAIHHHLIINGIPDTIKIIKKYWKYGHPNFTPLYEEDSYGELAEYLIKETQKTFKKNGGKRYSCSKNLKEPECHIEIVLANTFRREPKPVKGYYIQEVVTGTNEFGYRYQFYTMMKIKKRE